MVLLLLGSFTLMIRRQICLPNLLIANSLNSFTKTLVLSPWFDLLLFSSFLMHLHLVLCIVLFNMFLVVFFLILLYLVFHIKKILKKKIQKRVCLCTLVLMYLGWSLKQNFKTMYLLYLRWASLCTTKQVSFMAHVCDE